MGNLPHLSDLELIDYIVAHVLGTGGDGLIHKDQARRLLELAGEKVPEELERQEFWQLDLKHPCFIRLTHEVIKDPKCLDYYRERLAVRYPRGSTGTKRMRSL